MNSRFLKLVLVVLGLIVSVVFAKQHLSIFLFGITFLCCILYYRQFVKLMHSKYSKIWLFISVVIVTLFALNMFTSHADNHETQNTEIQIEKSIEKTETIETSENSETSETSDKINLRHEDGLDTSLSDRLISFIGIFVLIFLSWLMSVDKKNVNWRPVIWGVVLQLVLGIIILSPQIDAAVKSVFGIGTGEFFFNVIDGAVNRLLSFSQEGAAFVFGKLAYGPGDPRGFQNGGMFFFFNVLTTIVFFSSIMTLLYHTGIMEKVIKVFALVMQKTMKTSGSETLSAAANIFVGQTEAPLVVKPFVKSMTMSELHAVMTGGFATVAGGVMAAYVMFLKDYIPNIAGHLVTASIMSAPAALAISKVVFPETESSLTAGDLKMEIEKPDANLIEAASRGATEGMTLMLNVAAMLIAFVAIIAMINFGLETFSDWTSYIVGKNPYKLYIEKDNTDFYDTVKQGDVISIDNGKHNFTVEKIKLEKGFIKVDERIKTDFENTEFVIKRNNNEIFNGQNISGETNLFFINLSVILAWIFAPISWIMGVQWSEVTVVGKLLGEKLVLTEFIAYLNLAGVLKEGFMNSAGEMIQLSQRSAVIASYALCGFANFASIGIQIGGIGGIAPDRRADLAKIGMRSMFAGAIAACMTGTIAGILV